MILGGLSRVHTLMGTTVWLHGAWAGQNQFFRPLSSLVWWVVFQRFGNDLRAFYLLQYELHLTLIAVGFFFLWAVIDRRVAIIGSLIFALGLQKDLGIAAPTWALRNWFDSVEPLWGIFYLLCLLSYHRYLQTKSLVGYAGAIILMLMTIGCKETGLTLPIALFALLCYEAVGRQIKVDRLWRSLIPFFALSVASFLYRSAIFHGRGAHYGSNGSAAARGLIALAGAPAATLLEHNFLPLALDLAAVAVWLFFASPLPLRSFRRWRGPLLCLLLALGLLEWTTQYLGSDFITTIAAAIIPNEGQWISDDVLAAGQLILIIAFFHTIVGIAYRSQKAVLMALFAVTLAPSMTAQVTDHVQYVPAFFYAGAWGVVLLELWEKYVAKYFPPRRKSSRLLDKLVKVEGRSY